LLVAMPFPLLPVATHSSTAQSAPTLIPSPLGVLPREVQRSTTHWAAVLMPSAALPLATQSTTTDPMPSEMPALPLASARTASTRTPETAVFSVTTPLPGQLRTVPLRMVTF